MIFVSVGMHIQGFDRLIQKMDEIAGEIDEEVIMQIGFTQYQPKNAKYFNSINELQKIQELNRKARIVVCHGGAGTIITALAEGTPVIAIPRLKKYNEHLNDHQLELVNELAKNGIITKVQDINELEHLIKIHDGKKVEIKKERELLIKTLREYIDNLEEKRRKKN